MGCVNSTAADSPTLRRSTRRAISTVTPDPDPDPATLHSLSFTALLADASDLIDVNRDALDNIGQLKDEISSNPDLLFFVKYYLQTSIHTLRFFSALKDSLSKARGTELLVDDTLLLFRKGHDPSGALKKLQEFKDEGDHFTEKFVEEFKLVCERQQSILHDLLLRKKDLDQKLREVKAWRKVWNIVYSAVFAAVLISSVVLAAVAAPPAVTAAAAAVSGAMAPLQQWLDSIWDNFQNPYEVDRKIIDSLWKETSFAIHVLNSIRSLVESLEEKIRSMMIHTAEFVTDGKEKEKLKAVMIKIKRKAGEFAERVEQLQKEVDRRDDELKRATATILQTFTD
ncbi:Bacterial hemolysins domain-containing protein [Dioscorea alata]|uniref:Bacterial hemolysins domain-containing protein n=1 Tax=Dioscorea alata TaxID=55571 RepID=A0ACB7VQD9_DIOAL|nr:Bacterial hemolysins domain-containing protein [Dioscorea alata]